MAISLTKGQRIDLRKESPNLKRALVGLGWDPVKVGLFNRASTMDIDASVIMIGENGQREVVYYGHRDDRAMSIHHNGDNLTGDGDGDDEQIDIWLDKVPSYINRLSIIINIYNAYSKHQDFSKVQNCFVHVDDMDTKKELVRYQVSGNFNGMTGIFVADLYRYNGDWKFQAIGEGAKVANIDEMVQIKCNH